MLVVFAMEFLVVANVLLSKFQFPLPAVDTVDTTAVMTDHSDVVAQKRMVHHRVAHSQLL